MAGLLLIDSECLFDRKREQNPLAKKMLTSLVPLIEQGVSLFLLISEADRSLWQEWHGYLEADGLDCLGSVEYVNANEIAHDPAVLATLANRDRKQVTIIARSQALASVALTLGVHYIHFEQQVGNDWRVCSKAILFPDRAVRIVRTTNETSIKIVLDLDDTRAADIHTGIGFFDHMLEQIAKHSAVALTILVQGDLEIDEHHSVEDTALALGEAFSRALGDKRGLQRYGFTVPMDEARASVALDFSGRSHLEWEAPLHRERVGELPCELVKHFFQSFSTAAGLTVHVQAHGENDHHTIEAIFKAFGKALKQAIEREKKDGSIPSTKGVL